MDFNDREWRRLFEMFEKQQRVIESAMPKRLVEQMEQAAALRSSGLDRFAQSLETLGLGKEMENMRAQLETCTKAFDAEAALAKASRAASALETCTKALGAEAALAKVSGVGEAFAATWREIGEPAAGHMRSIAHGLDRLKVPDWPIRGSELDEGTKRALEMLQESVQMRMSVLEAAGSAFQEVEEAEQRPAMSQIEDLPPLPVPRPSGRHFPVAEALGGAQLTLAKLCLREQMWLEAEDHARQAADWLEDSPEPFIGLGIALNGQGRYRESVEAFVEAERRDSSCFTERSDVRAVYEASLQGRRWRWDGEPEEAAERES